MSARVIYYSEDTGHEHSVTVFGATGLAASLTSAKNFPISVADLLSRGTTRGFTPHPNLILQLEVWVAQNCIRDVYVDILRNRALFLDGHIIADKFFMTSDLPPVFTLALAHEDFQVGTQIHDWIMEHRDSGIRAEAPSAYSMKVCIPDEALAVMFKLKWSEYVIA